MTSHTKKEEEIKKKIQVLESRIKNMQDLMLQLDEQLRYIDIAMNKSPKKSRFETKSFKDRVNLLDKALINARDQNRNLRKNLGIRVNTLKVQIRDNLRPQLRK